MSRLQEIQQRADAATTGPWEYREDEAIRQPDGSGVVLGPWTNDGSWCIEISAEDAAFITAAREDVPWLLTELAETQAALEASVERENAVAAAGAQILRERDQAMDWLTQARRALADQERFNIESRRSLCEQSDRYLAQLAKVRELHWRYLPPAVDYDCCAHCNAISGGVYIPYPCPTVVAAGGEQS